MLQKSFLFLWLFGSLLSALFAQEKPEEWLQQAKKAYQQRNYNKAIEFIQKAKNKVPDSLKEEIDLIEGQCYFALNNPYQTVNLLENKIDQFKDANLKMQGHILLAKSYIKYNANMSARLLRHYEIPFQAYNEQFKKDGSKKAELLELLFDVQEILTRYWDDYETQNQWREEFNKLQDPKKNWNTFFQQKRQEMNQLRFDKIIAVYNYIQEVAGKNSQEAVRALFLKGCFYTNVAVDPYQQAQYYSQSAVNALIQQSLDKGIQAFREIPLSNNLADEAQFLAVYTLHHKKNDLVQAAEGYKQFIRQFSRSKWASDARHYLQQILEEEINLHVPRVFQTGETVKMNLQVRNTEQLKMEIRKVDLLYRDRNQSNYDYHAKQQARIQADKRIPATHQWIHQTGIQPNYLGVAKELELPKLETGAYVLTATGNKKQSQVVILVSNTVLISRQAKERFIAYLVDGTTGKPIPNASVFGYLNFSYPQAHSQQHYVGGKTNEEGLFIQDLKGYGNFYSYSSEFVAKDQEHYATAVHSYHYNSYDSRVFVLGYTNQPVYRPGQQVDFKLIFHSRQEGGIQTARNKMVKLFIQDPMGTKVYDKTVYTNEYGTLADSVSIKDKKDKPTLGLYQIIAQIDGNTVYQENWNYPNFRVEEYKKPEFKVSVTAITEEANFNEEVKAKIHGEYYFGGPVSGGTVSYTIYAEPNYPSYSPSVAYDWYVSRRRHHQNYYGRQHVASVSEQSLDTEGNCEITFTPKPLFGQNVNMRYTIEAQVVDKSRRMVQGQGSIYVSHQGFTVFLNSQKDLYLRGETAKVELVAKTANESPVQCQGQILVELLQGASEPPTYKEVLREPFQIENGKGLYEFITDEEGYFRISFQTEDNRKRAIRGECSVWVVSQEFRGNQSRFSDISLVSDQRSYRIGEKAQILLTSHLPDSYALISVIGDQSLIEQRVVRIDGKTALFSLEMTERCTPNIFVHAMVIKGHKIYQNTLEIAVPPLQCFANIEIETDKSSYLPGEKAKIKLKAKDYEGKPLAAELSLGVVDASLYYITPDQTPDLRQYYYGRARQNQLSFYSSLQFTSSASGSFHSGHQNTHFETHSLPDLYQRHIYGLRITDTWSASSGFADDEQSGGGGRHRTGRAEEESDAAPEPSSELGSSKEMAPNAPSAKKASAEKSRRDSNEAMAPRQQLAGKEGAEATEFKEAKVRTDFKDSCFWNANIVTDAEGNASVEVELPDNLTTWTLTCRGLDQKNRVGQQKKEILTQKEVLIRPQQPRFFRERDWVTLSAIVQNNLPETLEVKVILEIDNQLLTLVPMPENEKERLIKIRGQKDYRIDWVVAVRGEGETRIKMSALTKADSDAVEQKFPVYLHGIEKYVSQNGLMVGQANQLAGDQSHTLMVSVPEERIPESTQLKFTLSPSMASVVLEALPYLAQYPYGCVEQTMSRFLPSVLAAKTLKNLGLSMGEFQTQYNPKITAGEKLPPVACLDDRILADMVEAGKLRLYDFQHSDGGWGWWKQDQSNLYMTSYVLFGLSQASQAGVSIEKNRLLKGSQFLLNQLVSLDLNEEKELGNRIEGNRIAYMLYTLATIPEAKPLLKEKLEKEKEKQTTGYHAVLNFLFQERDVLNDYGRSLLALTFHELGKNQEAKELLSQILDNGVVEKENGTMHFGQFSGYYYWYQDGVEATAYALKAFVAIDPNHEAIPQIAKWLILKRNGVRWKSTKDTAIAIYGLLDYLKLTGELNPNYTLQLSFGSKFTKTVQVTKASLFSPENEITIPREWIESGSHSFTIEKQGTGNLYYSLALSYFTLEEDITDVHTEIEIQRKYFKVAIQDGKETRTELENGAILKSGDLLDVELEVKVNQDAEYLLFEDYKPSGIEALELTSGYGGGSYVTHREMRDELVAFFCSYLPKGTHQFSYRLRAEIPGKYHGMPARAEAMYAPHLRANSQEWRCEIVDE